MSVLIAACWFVASIWLVIACVAGLVFWLAMRSATYESEN